MTAIQHLNKEYKALCAIFGIAGGLWHNTHCRFSHLCFCKANREAYIAEYLVLKDFVQRAKEIGFVYYFGIDEFLEAYKDAVESRINID